MAQMTKAADEVSGELVDPAQLLTATKLTGHFVFDPGCLGGAKSFARLDRTAGLVHFQLRDGEYSVIKAPRKFCINSTGIDPKHAAPPIVDKDFHEGGY
jgi:hypothetical protein